MCLPMLGTSRLYNLMRIECKRCSRKTLYAHSVPCQAGLIWQTLKGAAGCSSNSMPVPRCRCLCHSSESGLAGCRQALKASLRWGLHVRMPASFLLVCAHTHSFCCTCFGWLQVDVHENQLRLHMVLTFDTCGCHCTCVSNSSPTQEERGK